MNPEFLLEAAAQVLRARPPAGIDAAYIDGFLARNHAQLVEIVRRAFSTPSREPPLRRFEEEHRLARKVLQFTVAFLAQPKRDPDEAELLAEMIDGIADHAAYEDRVLFPALLREAPVAEPAIEHAMGEHELIGEHLFALTAALRSGRPYDGPAVPLILHHFEEEEEALLPLAGAVRETPAGVPGRLQLLRHRIDGLPPVPVADGVATPGGGLRSRLALSDADLVQGLRVVTEGGLHGHLSDVRRFRVATLARRSGERPEESVTTTMRMRFDSGREEVVAGPLYPELAPAPEVTTDVSFDGAVYLSPRDAWTRILVAHRQVSVLEEKTGAARKPDHRARLHRDQADALRRLRGELAVFTSWMAENPKVPMPDLSRYTLRLITLEVASSRTPAEEWELAVLRLNRRITPAR